MMYSIENYEPVSFANKLKKLIDCRYADIPERQRRNKLVKDYDLKYPSKKGKSLENPLKQWMGYRCVPSMEKLLNICELLECDIDYFLTDQKEFKKEIASAAEVTGLPYDSVERLYKYSKGSRYLEKMDFQFIKLMLSSDDIMKNIVSLLAAMVFGLDDDECTKIMMSYDRQVYLSGDEDLPYFNDVVDIPYCCAYNERIYVPTFGLSEFGSASYELAQELTKLKQKERAFRDSFTDSITILVDKEDPDMFKTVEEIEKEIEKNDRELNKIYSNWLESRDNLNNRGIKIEIKNVESWNEYDWQND